MGHDGRLRDRGRDRVVNRVCYCYTRAYSWPRILFSPLLAFGDHAHILAITLFARSSTRRSRLKREPSSTAR